MQQLKSYQLAVKFYSIVKNKKLISPIKNQLIRASSSIALNLSEGTGRNSLKDKLRFFDIAMGSIRECQSILELEPDSFSEKEKDMIDHLAASTYQLIRFHRSP